MSEARFRKRLQALRRMVDRASAAARISDSAADLKQGCAYILTGGGKRLRATLLLLSCEAVGGSVARALPAATAIELLHNFTLVHDDIMDHAPARRGRPTVHVRWDVNTALLVGDVIIGLAYKTLFRTRTLRTARLAELFTSALLEVCEGQALDLEFERQNDVTVHRYFTMIGKKTGRLIAVATEMGGVIGGGTARQVAALRSFGFHLGRAFQLQDDLLDVVANEKDFGKTIGGDIVEGKRTFLLLRAAARARGKDRGVIARVLRGRGKNIGLPVAERKALIISVTRIYRRYGVIEEAEEQVRHHTARATAALVRLPRNDATAMLRWLADELVHRTS